MRSVAQRLRRSPLGYLLGRIRFLPLGKAGYYLARSRMIPGFLTRGESLALFRLAERIARNGTIVEIGSWQGRSSVLLGGAVRPGRGRVLCIDPFNTDSDSRSREEFEREALMLGTAPDELLDGFMRNIRAAGLEGICIPVKGYSFEIVSGWNEPIDLLFLDGNHEYDAVRGDFDSWGVHIRPGGILVLHDMNFPGPSRLAEESLAEPEWTLVERIDHLAAWRRS